MSIMDWFSGEEEPEPDPGYCDTSSADDGYIKQWMCGGAEVWNEVAPVANNAIEEGGKTGRKGLNLGALGLAGGGVAATIGTLALGTILVVAADATLFNGQGTKSVIRAVRGK